MMAWETFELKHTCNVAATAAILSMRICTFFLPNQMPNVNELSDHLIKILKCPLFMHRKLITSSVYHKLTMNK